MNRLFASLCLIVLLLHAGGVPAAENTFGRVGTLNCKVMPHSGINLLLHSTREMCCEFTSLNNRFVEYYKGKTGIGLGLDVSFNRQADIAYSVLAKHFRAGIHQLAGKYSGASGSATLGVSAGDTAPIQKDDKSISLQPIQVENSGIGVAAGFSYLYLEADNQ